MPIIKFGFGSQRLKNVTKEQEKIIKILSHNNKYQYEDYLHSTPEELANAVSRYKDRKPVIEDLQNQKINIPDIDYLEPASVDEAFVVKAIPILLKWLRLDSTPLHVKNEILRVLTRKPYAKAYLFDEILQQFELITPDQLQKIKGFYNMFIILLGNAVSDWMDDEHANTLFHLLQTKKFSDITFLVSALLKLKKKEHKEKAKEIAMQALQQPHHSNEALSLYMYVLQKLKAKEATPIIEKFLDFPKNYTRNSVPSNTDDFNPVEDKHVRKSAQKTLEVLEKLT